MKFSKNVRFAILSSLVLAGSACGVRIAQAPREDVSATDANLVVRSFPRQNITFTDSQLFLWKKDATPSDVSLVLQSSEKYEKLKVILFPMVLRRRELKKEFDDLFHGVKLDETTQLEEKIDIVALPEKEAALAEKVEEIGKLKAQLEELQKAPQSAEGDTKISRLKAKITVKEEMLKPTLKALAVIEETRHGADYAEWKPLETGLARTQAEASAVFTAINSKVWLFESSAIMGISFSFERNHSIRASISNWDLARIHDPEVVEEGVPKDFSTDLFTIGRVHYQELGGVFDFEVYTPRSTYWFKIARNNYGAQDGRIHYKGDIIRCSVTGGAGRPVIVHNGSNATCGVSIEDLDLGSDPVGKTETRRGAANLTDLDEKP